MMKAQPNQLQRCLLVACLSLAITGRSFVDTKLIAADGTQPAPQLEEMRVPESEIPAWLRKGWVPVALKEYRNWRQFSGEEKNQPRKVWVERAEYSAVYSDGVLQGGTLQAEVRHRENRPHVLVMNPLNLAVSEVKWDNEPAVWGTSPAGQTVLWAAPDADRLFGRWTLKGRQLAQSTDFDVQLMPSTISQIRIKTPSGHRLSSSVGKVTRIDSDNDSQWIEWLVDLGSLYECRLTIYREQTNQRQESIVLAERVQHFNLQPNGLSFESRFDLEVLGVPLKKLRFSLPDDIRIESITYGRTRALSFQREERPTEGPVLVVDLPDALIGLSRPIRIEGTGPSSLTSIPDIRLDDSIFIEGQLHLLIESPLVLKSLSAVEGYRQTAYVSHDGGGETFSFQQFHGIANIHFEAGRPQLNVGAKVVSVLRLQSDSQVLETEIHWETLSGSTFTTRCMIPAGWDIQAVRNPLPRTEAQFRWESERQEDGQMLLTIEFPDALSSNSSKDVQVVLQKIRNLSSGNSPVPVISPLDCQLVKQLIVLPDQKTDTMPFQESLGFEPIDIQKIDDIAPFLYDTQLGKDLVETSQESLKFFYSSSTDPLASFASDNEMVAIDVVSLTDVTCVDGQINEKLVLDIRPRVTPLSVLRVYVPISGRIDAWNIGDTNQPVLPPARLPVSQHRNFGLTEDGELWEFRFTKPVRERVELTAMRTGALADSEAVTLPFVLQADNFRGEVRLNGEHLEAYNLQTIQLQSPDLGDELVDNESTDEEAHPKTMAWTYQDVGASLTINVPPQTSDNRKESMLASLSLQSVLRCDGNGNDAHTATFTTSKTSQATPFSFQLPPSATLVSVLVNKKPVSPNSRAQDYRLPVLPPNRKNRVEVYYLTTSVRSQLRTEQSIPLPKAKCDVVNFQWHCLVPPDIFVVGSLANSQSTHSNDLFCWTERFFGPLGRSADEAIFLLEDSSMHYTQFEPNSALSLDTIDEEGTVNKLLPKGWNEIRLAHPVPPQLLTCTTGQRSLAIHWSWVVLLFTLIIGLFLRTLRASSNRFVAGVWLSGCFIAAWLSTPFVAILFGAGITGSLLAILFPSQWLRRKTSPKISVTEEIPLGSTATHHPATMLLLAMFGVSSLLAQWPQNIAVAQGDPGNNVSQSLEEQELSKVIIPQNDGLQLPVVYVHRDIVNRFRELSRVSSQPFDYLISGAKYEAVVGPDLMTQINATYRVAVPVNAHKPNIHLPITQAVLGGEPACTVNNKAHPIFLSERGAGYRIELEMPSVVPVLRAPLPADNETSQRQSLTHSTNDNLHESVVWFDIGVQLHPVPSADNRTNGFDVGIPSVSNSQLNLELPQSFEKVTSPTAFGRINHEVSKKSMEAMLGRTNRLSIEWMTGNETRANAAHVDLKADGQAWIFPTKIDYLYRIQCDVTSGKVDHLAWKLPSNTILRKSSIRDADGYNFQTVYKEGLQLVVEFIEPRSKDFVVELEFSVPASTTGNTGVIELVGWDPLSDSPSPAVTVDNQSHRIGLVTSEEFIVSMVEKEGAQPDAISPETFLTDENKTAGFRQPAFAFDVSKATSLDFEIKLRPTRREVRSQQVGVIHKREILWTYKAEVRTVGPGTFQHHVLFEENLSLENVSVKEDGVERLGRWSREGNRLALYLNEKTTGFQDIVIKGRSSVPADQLVELPIFSIEQSESAEALVHLFHRPGVVIAEPQFPDDFVPFEGSLPLEANRAGHFTLGSFSIKNPTKMISADVKPKLKLLDRSDHVVWDSLTQLIPLPNSQWNMKTTIRFHNMVMPLSDFQIHVPTELVDRLKIQPVELQKQFSDGEKGIRSVLLSRDGHSKAELFVDIESTVTNPTGDWILPQIGADYASDGKHYFSIPLNAGYRPLGSQIRPVNDLPDWVSRQLTGQEEQPLSAFGEASVFASPTSNWSLTPERRSTRPVESSISLMETVFWIGSNNVDYARTNFVVKARANCLLDLNWPDMKSVRFGGLFVDGIPQSLTEANNVPERIAIDEATTYRNVTLFWSRKRNRNLPRLGNLNQNIPTVTNLNVDRSLSTVLPAAGSHLYPGQLLSPLTYLDRGVDVLSSYVSEPNELRVSTVDDVQRVQQLVKYRDLLERQLEQYAWTESYLRPTTSQLARFKKASLQVDRLDKESQSVETPNVESAEFQAGVDDLFLLQHQEGVVHGQLRLKNKPMMASVWVVNQKMSQWLIGIFGVAMLTPVLMILLKTRAVRWLQQHQLGGLIVLSAIWWAFFSVSVIGILLFIYATISIALQFRNRNSPQLQTVQRT